MNAMARVEEIFETDPISSLGLSDPVMIGSDASVGTALEAVQQHGMGYVLISDAGRPRGIMSEREVLMRLVARGVRYDDSCERFMTPDPLTLTETATIAKAIRLMHDRGAQYITIVDNEGRAVAVLRTLDIIRFLAEAFPAQVLNKPPRPHQTMEQPEGA